jgi:hypothetical protein
MENSRRSKKRSKFFWPEIGLLILGVLGFKPDLLYDIIGIGSQSPHATTRPINQQQPISQQPLTSNPLLAWGVQAIQSAASQSLGGLPVASPPYGQNVQTQQPYYPNHAAVQSQPYQQQLNYGDYGNLQYQPAPTVPGYYSPNTNWPPNTNLPPSTNWVAANNNNSYPPAAATNYSGAGIASRVPPADYQNTPASYPAQSRPSIPFPSTSAFDPYNNAPYGSNYGANVRKEETGYQPYYASNGTGQSHAYSNLPNQTPPHSQNQYFWGAVDPRVNNMQRAGTQGSWVPNVPASNLGAGRVGRY